MRSVCIVEDNEPVRQLLVRALRQAQFRCLGSYANGEAALAAIPKLKPELVIMDINLPGMDGIECTRALRAAVPGLTVLVLTEHDDSERVFGALQAGAVGYLLRQDTGPDKLAQAIDEALRGGSPMSPPIARRVVRFFVRSTPAVVRANLSPREHQVLDCLAEGWLYKQIADRLGISIDTVRRHLKNIYRKLEVNSRTEAVVRYLRHPKINQRHGHHPKM
jgi:DNA-binding NarL/FixJ family response regulator